MKQLLIPRKINLLKRRFGKNEDGGYILSPEVLGKSEVVYSYGLGDIISFDVDVANTGKKVFMYDHTIKELPENHENFIFFKKPFTKDFLNNLKENNHDKYKNITLKLDIEGAEWELNNIDGFDKYFSQIIIEFHGLRENNENQIKLLEKLNKNYYIYHIHGNNHGPRRGWLPDTLEITFLRKDLFESEPPIETEKYPIEGLDFKNYQYRDEYILDWWL